MEWASVFQHQWSVCVFVCERTRKRERERESTGILLTQAVFHYTFIASIKITCNVCSQEQERLIQHSGNLCCQLHHQEVVLSGHNKSSQNDNRVVTQIRKEKVDAWVGNNSLSTVYPSLNLISSYYRKLIISFVWLIIPSLSVLSLGLAFVCNNSALH